jgi:SAM-dependent methyltransferase
MTASAPAHGMDPRELQAMLDHDEHHWWYRGRRRIVRAELDKLALGGRPRVLDAGCGSGRTLDELAGYGEVSGIDLSEAAVGAARERGHADLHVGPVERLPWPDATFDLVTSLDVIEHTDDDRVTLRELLRVTKPGGHLLVTVPAYQALWSAHDVVNLHKRRYDRRMLRAAAAESGWSVERMTAFNSLLLAPAAAVRLLQRLRPVDPATHTSELELSPPWLNATLELPLRAEAAWLARGRTLPAGLSLLALLRRPAGTSSGLPAS